MLQWIGLTKEDELAQEIDEDRIRYVAVPAHDLFVHRHNHDRIARLEIVLGFQPAIVERIDGGLESIGLPFLALCLMVSTKRSVTICEMAE